MYKIFMTSDTGEEFCMSSVKTYVVDENYIFIKNDKDYIWYMNKNYLRTIFIKEEKPNEKI